MEKIKSFLHNRPHLKAFLIFTLLTIIFTWPLLLHLTTHYPSTLYGEGGDPNMYIWFMNTMAHKATDFHFQLKQLVFFPDGMNFFVLLSRIAKTASSAVATIIAISRPANGEPRDIRYATASSVALIRLEVSEMRLPDTRQPMTPPTTSRLA